MLNAYFPAFKSRSESDAFRSYFGQARMELGFRLLDRCFNKDGSPNKWWLSFSKRKFMGKTMIS